MVEWLGTVPEEVHTVEQEATTPRASSEATQRSLAPDRTRPTATLSHSTRTTSTSTPFLPSNSLTATLRIRPSTVVTTTCSEVATNSRCRIVVTNRPSKTTTLRDDTRPPPPSLPAHSPPLQSTTLVPSLMFASASSFFVSLSLDTLYTHSLSLSLRDHLAGLSVSERYHARLYALY